MQVQEEKVKILAAIWGSLPVIAEEAALLQAAGVPKPDAAIILGPTISSQEESGTSAGGIAPQGPRIIGTPALPSCQITPDFLHPLTLPAKCLLASDWDLVSDTKKESGFSNGSEMEPGEVCPHSQIFRT